jgi:DNA-3-methyladenine glycosylase I
MAPKVRCNWCGTTSEYVAYHDTEWGVPAHDDRHLFEMINLEGAQAGLSWITILRKRAAYREAFDGFDPALVALYRNARIERLLKNPGIVRNRAKIEATVMNARATLAVQKEFGSLDRFLWSFVDGKPIQNQWHASGDVPASTEISERMSKELLKRGFRFVGPTICYAFMQAVGMVNDHVTACYRHAQVARVTGAASEKGRSRGPSSKPAGSRPAQKSMK